MRQAPILAYYGDDLTGSTDVMEAMALAGVPTVLFLAEPSRALLERFPACRAIGLAGTSRSRSPQWMEENSVPAFAWLKQLGAPICHYKVCSTFNSSPTVGSIGRAIEIGRSAFGGRTVPLVVGGPQLRRYTAFGELFAAFRGETYRIDRHPVMSRHPVTPMTEADLRRHLSRQTGLAVGLVDFIALRRRDADALVDDAARESPIVILDVLDQETQAAAGRQMLRLAEAGPLFVAGSSGVEYALVEAWRNAGEVGAGASFPEPGPVGTMAVVSGSVSPTTERQIAHAAAHGFEAIPLDPRRFGGTEHAAAVAAAIAAGSASLAAGRSVILHTALGPSSDLGADLDARPGGRDAIGEALGDILGALVGRHGLRRAVIAGGDTSSHALARLGVEALTVLLPLPATPGSPLCLAHGENLASPGLEIALKGGQIGRDDYFCAIREGRA